VAIKDKKTTEKSKSTIEKPAKAKKGMPKIVKAIGSYFKGAWVELRQVRWPNRKATWGLTFAVILFTAFFATLIVLLDAMFKQLFELLILK